MNFADYCLACDEIYYYFYIDACMFFVCAVLYRAAQMFRVL